MTTLHSLARFVGLLAFGLLSPSQDATASPLSDEPVVELEFPSAHQGSPGTTTRADPSFAVGPAHVFQFSLGNVSIFDRVTGAEVHDEGAGSFFSVGGLPGVMPRVVFDPHSQRFFAAVIRSTQADIMLAVSSSADPLDPWFTAIIPSSVGTDAMASTDGLRIGFDPEGIYLSALMFHPGGSGSSAVTSTVWAIDKAPLIAPAPSLGAVTAFRDLFAGWGVVPCRTDEDSGGQYFLSCSFFTNWYYVYQLEGPITAPTLTGPVTDSEIGNPTAPTNPDPEALGSGSELYVLDIRFQSAAYHDGSIWTARHTGSNHSYIQWFELDAATAAIQQNGFISDPDREYYLPSVDVAPTGDVLISFCGSSDQEYIGAYFAGRHAQSPPGAMSEPQLLQVGAGAQTSPGANSWGFYTDVCRDPVDPTRLWCLGLYGDTSNQWGTRIARMEFPCQPPVPYCTTSPNSEGAGALILAQGLPSVSENGLVLRSRFAAPGQFGIFYYGDGATAVAFGDGVRCVNGSVFRLPIVTVQPDGSAVHFLDVEAPPEPAGTIDPGSTWNFQFWYRDPAFGGAGFNLSDALEVSFCP